MANLPGENEKVHPCEICGRNFVKNSLEKHEVICRKMIRTKRKVFDSGKQRATGSDITIDNVINARKEREKLGGTFPRPKTSWRERHETFVNAVSTSKQANHTTFRIDTPFSSLPKMPVPKDYVKCEYCGRSFNEAAAERHIPFCKTQQEKKGPVKVQKMKSRQSNVTMMRSEVNDCHRLNNISSNRDSKMRSKKEDCHPATPERRSSISSRRSESSQRRNNSFDKIIGQKSNASERERINSSTSYRANNREKSSALISRQSSLTRKGSGTEKSRKK
uniref:Zinc finger C2HC domain-containing protein 1A n=1 Tax=Elaeophora elaphi TaxID=1147741 RepID=A0A0R3RT88_9BILA